MCLQRPRNEIYLITTIQVNTLQPFTDVERPSKKILRPKLTSVKLKRRQFFRLSKPIIGASFFKKWQILHFPAIKTDWWVVGCSNYYQSISWVIRKWKHMHILGLWRLDPAESASESHCKHFKKKLFLGSVTYKILVKNMIFYKILIYFQIVSLRPYDVLDDSLINFIWSLLSKWILYNCLRVLKDLQKYFWDQNWPQWSSKNDRFQALKTHYRSIIFQKMTNSAFSCNKNGLVGRRML